VHLLAEKTKSTKIFKNSLIGLLVIGISLPPRKYPKRLLIFIGLVKPVIIMANVRIIFIGRGLSFEKNTSFLECELEGREIAITIRDESEKQPTSFISLDKSTAIRLAKKLRTEISKMGEEVYNG